MLCDTCKKLVVERCRFSDLKGTQGAAISAETVNWGIYQNTTRYIVEIKESTFTSCEAEKGGALYLHDINAHIISSEFFGTTASDRGGGAVFECSYYNTDRLCDYLIEKSTFSGNRAKEGGAIFWDFVKVMERDNIFTNNLATYGNDKAS